MSIQTAMRAVGLGVPASFAVVHSLRPNWPWLDGIVSWLRRRQLRPMLMRAVLKRTASTERSMPVT